MILIYLIIFFELGDINNKMFELIELYEKNNHTSDKWGIDGNTHSYLTIYDKIFNRLKNNNNKILEIGVYKGDSLNLWAEYFTNSKIYGVDCHISQIDVDFHDNVGIIEVPDAYTIETIKILHSIGRFDIIIDDGSHRIEHQKYIIENYCDLLTENGILIIEDAVCWIDDGLKIDNINILMGYFSEDLKAFSYYDDRRHIKNNSHDFLIICDRGGKGVQK